RAGFASHTPSDARCDDLSWCSGVEVCAPGQPGTDASGCKHTNVPQPPAATACLSYGACVESSRSFARMPASSGTTCSDGLACTLGDACDGTGACRGTVTPACTASGCTATHSGSGDIDIPVAVVTGMMTLGGAALPQTNGDYYGADIYLVAKDTGAA